MFFKDKIRERIAEPVKQAAVLSVLAFITAIVALLVAVAHAS